MVVLSREAFDAIEFDAAYTGDHRAAAEQMTRLADTGTQSRSMPRSEAYLRAGEEWLLADDPAAAANGFMRAIADGGPASIDPRAPLARALFMLGRTDEANAIVRDLALEEPRNPRLCDLMAELLVERSDLERALAWATAGVDLCLGGQPGPVAAPPPPAEAGGPPAEAGGPPAEPGGPPAAARPAEREGPAPGKGKGPAPGKGRRRQHPWARLAAPGGGRPALPPGDRTELRLLLTLRYRVRNDLGLAEDAYDTLLDELLSEAGGSATD